MSARRWNDSDLEGLLRLAGEAERLDGCEVHPFAAAPARSAPARLARAAAGVAACAALAFGAWLLWNRPGLPANSPGPDTTLAHGAPKPAQPSTPATAPSLPAGRGAVVLSISEDDHGALRCVAWSPSAWGERTLAEITPEELQAAGLAVVCAQDARRLLVIGMEGPQAKLPGSDARALELARCMITTPACSAKGFDPAACSAGGCVPDDVTVRVESIAMNR